MQQLLGETLRPPSQPAGELPFLPMRIRRCAFLNAEAALLFPIESWIEKVSGRRSLIVGTILGNREARR